ncbi:UNVERIFIED_CONTAM: hypothetical protein HDU68_010644 [Siphonaria sp. JEL0065]|nr:hypothetical protein HDU68_010644 [Siphonaria sp. JEL0065]
MDNNQPNIKGPPPPPPPRAEHIPDDVKAQIVLSMSQEYSLDEYFEEFQASLQSENSAASMPQIHMPIKKTPFQLKKEAEEAKRKRNEEEAALALQEFEESFDTNSSSLLPSRRGFVAKAWVKGGAIQKEFSEIVDDEKNDTSRVDSDGFYRPHLKLEQTLQQQQQSATLNNQQQQQQRVLPNSAVPPSQSKKRQLDAFLQEIKQQHETPSAQRPRVYGSATITADQGSHDTGDGRSANLFIGNLQPSVTERQLLHLFAQHGPIGSIKVMWPRTQEEIDRGRNTGFVGFMKREDAEKALKALDLKMLEGREMRIGWAKAAVIPNQPIFVLPTADHNTATSTVDSQSSQPTTGLPFNAQIPPPPILKTTSDRRKAQLQQQKPKRPEVRVVIPRNKESLMRIHRMIQFILVYGPTFEAAIMGREKGNPEFAFLFDHANPDHVYYRWKLYSMLHGDTKLVWNLKPFQMFDEGATWIPPPVPFDEHGLENNTDSDTDYSSNSDSDSDSSYTRNRKKKRLQSSSTATPKKRQYLPRHKLRLQTRLRNLSTNSRSKIATLMLFILSHASTDPSSISTTVIESLMHPDTPLLPQKLARLHLVSDVLHNSASPAVQQGWKYRGMFEKNLGQMFRHFGECWRGVEARLRAEQWKRGVLGVVGVWERWGVFDVRFLEGLRREFQEGCDGGGGDGEEKGEEKEKGEKMDVGEDEEDVVDVPMAVDAVDRQEVERPASAGFKPIGGGGSEVSRVSKFSPIGAAPPSFVPATTAPVSNSSYAHPTIATSGRLSGFPATSVPVIPAVKPTVQTAPPVKKAVSRVVAGAASVFQNESDSE